MLHCCITVSVLLSVPVDGRLLEREGSFLALRGDTETHLESRGQGQQPTEVVVPLPYAPIQNAPGIHFINGEHTRMMFSRTVALSDPVLDAAVKERSIPTWVRECAVFVFLGGMLLVYFLALSEEVLTDGSGAELEPATVATSATVSKITTGPTLPVLTDAVAKKVNVASLIKAMAAKRSGKVALVDADGKVIFTYGDLMKHVEALAKCLLDAGLTKGDIVATIMKPGPQLLVASLGIIHAQMVWAPLDGDSPAPWRADQLSYMGGRLQLVGEEQFSKISLENPLVPAWCLDAKGKVVPSGQLQVLTRPSTSAKMPDGSVLIIHTSGSTGRPKAVLYSSAMMLHSILTLIELCRMDENTVQLLKTPSTWAVVEFELFPALVAGGSVVADWQCAKNFEQLAKVLVQRNITTLITSAPVLRLLIDDYWTYGTRPKALQHILNVGAGIPLDVCKTTCDMLGNDAKVHNSYAATETSTLIWSYSAENDFPKSAGASFAPAGVPDFDVEVYLLDNSLQEVGDGQSGEVCIAGMYLATGYWGDEETTNKKFMANPFGKGRLYRTGDVGRWEVDPVNPSKSALKVIGRVDRQTNIRGMRVAPEDVESSLRKMPEVGEVAVVVGKVDGVAQCLVACVSPATGCQDQLESPVKKYCTESLPQHFRPEFVLQYRDLPKLANGKVDMTLLGKHASDTVASTENSAPDSLGLLRKVGKDLINEMDTMSAARGIAILPVLLFHWYYMPIAWYYPDVVTRQFPYPSVLFMNIAVGMNWSMQLFVIASAFQDRSGTEQRRPGEWRGDLLVVILLMLTFRPVPKLLEMLCWAAHGFAEPLSKFHIEAQTGVRWYLYFYLICRALSFGLFGPCLSALQRCGKTAVGVGSTAMVLFWFAVAWMGETKTSDGHLWWEVPTACPGYAQNSTFVWSLAWLLPGVNESDSKALAYCPLLPHQTFLWYLAIYTAGWWYGKGIIRWFKMNSPAVHPLIALPCGLLVMICFYYLEQYQVWTMEWKEPDAATWCLSYLVDLCMACSIFYALALMVRTRALHYLGLVFMGRYSLGSYIMHIYIFGALGMMSTSNPKALFHIPDVVDGIRAVEGYPGARYGAPQLVVLLAYPVLFMLTIGPLFQIGCVAAFNHSMKFIEHCADRLDTTKP